MPLATTTLNPGAGGAVIAVDQNTQTGVDTPVSELIVDGALVSAAAGILLPVGIGAGNTQPTVTSTNGVAELQVFNGRLQAAVDELRITLQTVSDALAGLNGALQVQATISGVVPVQFAPGTAPLAATLSGPIGNTPTTATATNEQGAPVPIPVQRAPGAQVMVNANPEANQKLDRVIAKLDALVLICGNAFGGLPSPNHPGLDPVDAH